MGKAQAQIRPNNCKEMKNDHRQTQHDCREGQNGHRDTEQLQRDTRWPWRCKMAKMRWDFKKQQQPPQIKQPPGDKWSFLSWRGCKMTVNRLCSHFLFQSEGPMWEVWGAQFLIICQPSPVALVSEFLARWWSMAVVSPGSEVHKSVLCLRTKCSVHVWIVKMWEKTPVHCDTHGSS